MKNDPASSKETLVLPDALIGKTVGAYQVRGLLGKGGMGVVYRAYDASLDREVALKVLPPGLSSDTEYAERFLREAKMAAKLDHPRIVPVYAAGTSTYGAYIAMQLVRGRTLHEEMHDGMRPSFAQAVKISRQVAEALGAANAAGLIHRDIKPANIIIDAAGDAKVLDFGLARPTHVSQHTQDGTYLGTPEYSSPEQCQTNDIDGRADLYSLGVVMYEILGGRIPHVAETPLSLFHKIVNESPIALRDLNPKVPPSLAAIVVKLMAKNRDARYASASAMIADLDRLKLAESGAQRSDTVIVGPADRARVAAWTLAAALAALLVAAVVHVGPWTGNAGAGSGQQNLTAGNGEKPVVRTPAALKGRIVFLDFKNLNGQEGTAWMAAGLPEMISFGLADRTGTEPIEHDLVIDAMRREFNAKLTSGGGDSITGMEEQGIRLLKALDADVLVRGRFYADGDTVQVMTYVYGLRDGVLEVLGHTTESGTQQEVLSIAERTAGKIADVVHPDEGERLRASRKALKAADSPDLSGTEAGKKLEDDANKEEAARQLRLLSRVKTLDDKSRERREKVIDQMQQVHLLVEHMAKEKDLGKLKGDDRQWDKSPGTDPANRPPQEDEKHPNSKSGGTNARPTSGDADPNQTPPSTQPPAPTTAHANGGEKKDESKEPRDQGVKDPTKMPETPDATVNVGGRRREKAEELADAVKKLQACLEECRQGEKELAEREFGAQESVK